MLPDLGEISVPALVEIAIQSIIDKRHNVLPCKVVSVQKNNITVRLLTKIPVGVNRSLTVPDIVDVPVFNWHSSKLGCGIDLPVEVDDIGLLICFDMDCSPFVDSNGDYICNPAFTEPNIFSPAVFMPVLHTLGENYTIPKELMKIFYKGCSISLKNNEDILLENSSGTILLSSSGISTTTVGDVSMTQSELEINSDTKINGNLIVTGGLAIGGQVSSLDGVATLTINVPVEALKDMTINGINVGEHIHTDSQSGKTSKMEE